MINRRLAIVNTLIVTVCLSIVVFSAYFALQQMFYRENAVIYSQLYDKSVSDLKELLDDGESYILSMCSSYDVQTLLKKGSSVTPEEFTETVRTVNQQSSVYEVRVLPIRDETVLREDYTILAPLTAYNYGHRYNWSFRPQGENVLRVSRIIYDNEDIDKALGVCMVDMALTKVETIFYDFENYVQGGNTLQLYDGERRLLPYYVSGNLDVLQEPLVESLTDVPFELKRESVVVARHLIATGWTLYGCIERTALLSGSEALTGSIIRGGLILGVIAVILTLYITNKITKPVLQLSAEVQETAQKKEYEHLQVPEHATGEVASLYHSYNNLIDEVNASFREVQEVSRKEIDTQFMLLQAQINPHFLYNTLNTISWMAKNGQTEDIDKMVVSLVTMFRNSINNNKPLITLEREIEHVSSYLNIMQYRYPNRYVVEYNIADNTRDLMVTKQILQPLAENALMHGFLEAGMQGRIVINSYLQDDSLVLEMRNTGSQADLDKIRRLLANDPELAQKHYGIRNVNDRLTSYYGPDSGLRYSTENGETVVSMRLPLDKVERGA